MHIIKPRSMAGWITAVIDGRWVQAKVYDEPSTFGIKNGRVSKCVIGKTATRNENKDFFEQMDYNYDRGLDYDNLPPGVLDRVVAELEALQ